MEYKRYGTLGFQSSVSRPPVLLGFRGPSFLPMGFHRVMALPSDIANTWLLKIARDVRFEQAIRNRRFRHPQTGNQVLFVSLPEDEQAKIRAQFQQQSAEEAAPEKKGPWTDRVLEAARGAVDLTTQAGKNLMRFIKEPEYRTEVKNAFIDKKEDLKSKLAIEARESKEMLATVKKAIAGEEISDEEKKAAWDQLKDVGKLAVLTATTVAPLGPLDDILLLVLTAGVRLAVPEFSWKPSAWRNDLKEADGKDLASRISDRLYQGMLQVLENPSEEMLTMALEEMGRTKA